MNNRIEIDNLSFAYHKKAPLLINGVSCKADSGTQVIIGPNGAGKSTLIKILSLTLKNFSGSIRFDQRDLNSLSLEESRKMISYLPQSFSRNFPVTVQEFLSLSGSDYHPRHDHFNISAILDCNLAELSGGELQKVNLTRVFLQDTPVTLLDEPNMNLDITSQFVLFDTIKKLQKDRIFFIVLHDLQMASRYFEQFILIGKYGFSRTGPKKEIFSSEIMSEAFHSCINVVSDPVWGGYYIQPVNQYSGTSDGKYQTLAAGTSRDPSGKLVSIHVVTGGGSGTEVFTELKRLEFKYPLKISTGVVNKFDTDWFIASEYGFEVVCEKPYSKITPPVSQCNRALIENSDIVLYIPHYIGSGNLCNLEAVCQNARNRDNVYIIGPGDGCFLNESDTLLKELKNNSRMCEKFNLEEIIEVFLQKDDK